jgi:hypothetical protein
MPPSIGRGRHRHRQFFAKEERRVNSMEVAVNPLGFSQWMARERLGSVNSISTMIVIGYQHAGVQPRRKHAERLLQQFQKAPAVAVVAKCPDAHPRGR